MNSSIFTYVLMVFHPFLTPFRAQKLQQGGHVAYQARRAELMRARQVVPHLRHADQLQAAQPRQRKGQEGV